MKLNYILKAILVILVTIGSMLFVFTAKGGNFETLTITILYSIFMEVMFPDKEK